MVGYSRWKLNLVVLVLTFVGAMQAELAVAGAPTLEWETRFFEGVAPASLDGSSVAISGGVALSGAPAYRKPGSSSETGTVSVLEFSVHEQSWKRTQLLEAPEPQAFSGFGESVEIIGDVAVVGAPKYRWGPGNRTGAIFVFEQKNNSGAFEFSEVLTLGENDESSSRFGDQIAIAVGTDGLVRVAAAGGLPPLEYVDVFARSQSGSWTSEARISRPSSLGLLGEFGCSLDLSSTRLAIGVCGATDPSSSDQRWKGVAYVFEKDGLSSGWNTSSPSMITPSRPATPLGPDSGGQGFGTRVQLAANHLFVEQSLSDTRASSAFEALQPQRDIHVFRVGMSGAWEEIQVLRAGGAQSSDEYEFFASAWTVHGDSLIVASTIASTVQDEPARTEIFGSPLRHFNLQSDGRWRATNNVSESVLVSLPASQLRDSLEMSGTFIVSGASYGELLGVDDPGGVLFFLGREAPPTAAPTLGGPFVLMLAFGLLGIANPRRRASVDR